MRGVDVCVDSLSPGLRLLLSDVSLLSCGPWGGRERHLFLLQPLAAVLISSSCTRSQALTVPSSMFLQLSVKMEEMTQSFTSCFLFKTGELVTLKNNIGYGSYGGYGRYGGYGSDGGYGSYGGYGRYGGYGSYVGYGRYGGYSSYGSYKRVTRGSRRGQRTPQSHLRFCEKEKQSAQQEVATQPASRSNACWDM